MNILQEWAADALVAWRRHVAHHDGCRVGPQEIAALERAASDDACTLDCDHARGIHRAVSEVRVAS